jgi:hypothetical protein
LQFKTNRNGFKNLASARPGLARGNGSRGRRPATNSARTASRASAYRLGPLAKEVRPAGARAPGVVTTPAGGLGVAAAVAASAPMEQGGVGQGGRGRSSPERWRGVEVLEDASGGGVQRR